MQFNNPTCDPLIDIVIDNYRLLEVVGQGGMGCVYKARDERMGRIVALKLIRSNLGAFSSREGKALGQLNHPNIVNVFYMSDSKEGIFIVMEFVDGTTLHEYMGHSVKDIIPIMKQSLLALEHAHESGVIHRDIKPSNIMVSKQGQVKVMDFGLAKVETPDTDKTVTRLQAGTISYMSPEQVRGLQHVSHVSDIYSIGKTFYHILARRLPFNASESDQYSILKAIIERQFKPPSHFNGEVPRGLDRIIMKAIEKEPSNRYQSAREMYAALLEFEAKHSPSSSKRASVAQNRGPNRSSLPAKSKQWIAGAVVALFVILAATVVVTFISNRDGSTTLADQFSAQAQNQDNQHEELPSSSPGSVDNTSIVSSDPERTDPAPETDTTRSNPVSTDSKALISIVTTPPNSQVTLGSESLGNPVNKLEFEAGTYQLSVAAEGYDSYTNTLSLSSSTDTSLSVVLLPQGNLLVDANVPGALISLDRRPVGSAPFNEQLPRGTYTLLVSAEGYMSYSTRVRVQSENETRISADLKKLSTLRVQVIPDGDLFVDSQAVAPSGESDWIEAPLMPGSHTVRVTHSEYGFWEKEIELSGDSQDLTIDFTKQVQVNIGSNIFGAAIYIDGELLDEEAPARINLGVGVRRIEVRKEGYSTDPPFIERLIEGTESDPIQFPFQLAKDS